MRSNLIRSILVARDGSVWLGTSSGITRYRDTHPTPPTINVDTVVADSRFDPASAVEIPTHAGIVAFHFWGSNLKTRPEAMVYRYRLTGLGKSWRTTKM